MMVVLTAMTVTAEVIVFPIAILPHPTSTVRQVIMAVPLTITPPLLLPALYLVQDQDPLHLVSAPQDIIGCLIRADGVWQTALLMYQAVHTKHPTPAEL